MLGQSAALPCAGRLGAQRESETQRVASPVPQEEIGVGTVAIIGRQ